MLTLGASTGSSDGVVPLGVQACAASGGRFVDVILNHPKAATDAEMPPLVIKGAVIRCVFPEPMPPTAGTTTS